MAALNGPRKVDRLAGGHLLPVMLAANAMCFGGGMAMLYGGFARPARPGQGGDDAAKAADVQQCRVVGVFQDSKTGGSVDGAVQVELDTRPAKMLNSAGGDQLTSADVGFECFVVDDQTVARTSAAGTRPLAGVVAQVEADGVFVDFSRPAGARRRKLYLPFSLSETDTLAGTSSEQVAPVAGIITGCTVTVAKAVTTGGNVTVKVGATDVDGLSVPIANGAAKGTVVSDTPTDGHASRAVAAGGRIQIVPSAAFDTAGALSGFVEISY